VYLSQVSLDFRVGLLLEHMESSDGVMVIRRMLTDRATEFGGNLAGSEVDSILAGAAASPKLDTRMAMRLALLLEDVREACSVDVVPHLEKLRERFPKACSPENVLALEVLES